MRWNNVELLYTLLVEEFYTLYLESSLKRAKLLSKTVGTIQGRHFNFFLGGQIFVLFFIATGLLKNWKNSTLYVVI